MYRFHFNHTLLQALVNAVSEVYSSTSLQLSEVYWRKNLRKKLLSHASSVESSLQDYVRTIWSVAFVPAGDISWYWEHIVLPAKPQVELEDSDINKERQAITQAVEDLLECVERNFIGRRDNEGSYERPLYSPEVWSKHNSAVQCQTLQTNKAEVTDFSLLIYCLH